MPDYVQTAEWLDCTVSVVVYSLRLRPEQYVGATFVRLRVSNWRNADLRSQEYRSYTPRIFHEEPLQVCLPGRWHDGRADHPEPVKTRPSGIEAQIWYFALLDVGFLESSHSDQGRDRLESAQRGRLVYLSKVVPSY